MILIVDDDPAVTASLSLLLKQAGYPAEAAATPAAALARLDRRDVRLVLQDMNFSRATTGEEGLRLLADIKARRPEVPVLLITAWGSIELAVEGMKAGAADFITKPWGNDQILGAVRTALELAASPGPAAGAAPPARADLDAEYDLAGIVGEDPGLLAVLELAGRIAPTDASVLITGESGTGKEVVAEAIHRNGPRRDGPFVRVNLGGIPPTLFESEMFGHVRGAFTDAHRDREGRFARANGGTILLDEVGELDLRCQVKLLRVLQDRTYEILGTSETRRLDVRVIAATNRDLRAAVAAGDFREDLLYRLNLISIRLPRLSERRGDIPLLSAHFVARAAATYERPVVGLTGRALAWLGRQEWPGNVRQLKHLIERTFLIAGGDTLDESDFRRTMEMEAAGTA
jgi:two-component system NtrC family response regulator